MEEKKEELKIIDDLSQEIITPIDQVSPHTANNLNHRPRMKVPFLMRNWGKNIERPGNKERKEDIYYFHLINGRELSDKLLMDHSLRPLPHFTLIESYTSTDCSNTISKSKNLIFKVDTIQCLLCYTQCQSIGSQLIHYLTFHSEQLKILFIRKNKNKYESLKPGQKHALHIFGIPREMFNPQKKQLKKYKKKNWLREDFESPFMKNEQAKFMHSYLKISAIDVGRNENNIEKLKKAQKDMYHKEHPAEQIKDKDKEDLQEQKVMEGRIYYHSTSGIPLTIDEVDPDEPDSEEELSEQWVHERRDKMIDDYTDVCDSDKKFFKIWNKFMDRFCPQKNLPHYMIVDACMYFSRYCAKEMGDLRMNFLTHCINYYDYQVLSPKQLYDIMMEFDKYQNELKKKEIN